MDDDVEDIEEGAEDGGVALDKNSTEYEVDNNDTAERFHGQDDMGCDEEVSQAESNEEDEGDESFEQPAGAPSSPQGPPDNLATSLPMPASSPEIKRLRNRLDLLEAHAHETVLDRNELECRLRARDRQILEIKQDLRDIKRATAVDRRLVHGISQWVQSVKISDLARAPSVDPLLE